MRRLITTDDIARYLKITASDAMSSHIDFAHAMVEAEIGASLQERSVRAKERILYDLAPDERIILRDGPFSSLTTITIDGVDAETLDSNGESDNLIMMPWSIRRADGFSKNSNVLIQYTAGWAPNNVNPRVKAALIQTAGMLYKQPDQSALMERIGDYMIQRASLTSGEQAAALSPQVKLLLRDFVKP